MKCICIKDGFMRSGLRFCVEAQVYDCQYSDYNMYKTAHPFRVDTNRHPGGCVDHTMSDDFFDEYFVKVGDDFLSDDKDFLNDDLFIL